jgi:hypothetical protein
VRRWLALGVVALVAGCAGGSDEQLHLPPGQSFAVSTAISPITSAFGDTVTARVRILADRRRVDPEGFQVRSFFQPFRDETTVERVDSGNLTAIVYTIRLQCLTLSCTQSDQRELTFRFGTRVLPELGPVQEAVFPEISIVTRQPIQTGPDEEQTGEIDQWPPAWRAAVTVPEPSYRASPKLLAWGLGGLGALLLLGSAAAAFLLLRRGTLLREREVSPLDRALAQLRSARTDEERRAALEALAVALDTKVEPELAEPARELAWSAPKPSESAAEEIANLAETPR